MFKKCLENRVIRKNLGYKCTLCPYENNNCNFDTIEKHMEIAYHRSKINKIPKEEKEMEAEVIESISETQRKKIVENNITFAKVKTCDFCCHACSCFISGLVNVFQHIKGNLHEKALETNLNRNNHQKSVVEVNKKQTPTQTSNQDAFCEIGFCSSCQVIIKDTTALQCHVMVHLFNDDSFDFSGNTDIIKCMYVSNNDTVIECLICNDFLLENVQALESHVNTREHLSRLDFLLFVKHDMEVQSINNVYLNNQKIEQIDNDLKSLISTIKFCLLCNVPVLSDKNKLEHEKGKRHASNKANNKIPNENEIRPKISTSIYTCFLCKISFNHLKQLIEHYNQKLHKQRMTYFNLIFKNSYIRFIKKSGKTYVFCTVCDIILENVQNAAEHLLGKRHKANAKNCSSKSSSTSSSDITETKRFMTSIQNNVVTKPIYESIQASTSQTIKKNELNDGSKKLTKTKSIDIESFKRLNPINIDDALNDLIDFDLSVKAIKKLPKSAKPGNSTTTKLAQPSIQKFSKNVQKFGKSFIKYCIESSNESIYYINPEQNRLMKLGVELTYCAVSERFCFSCKESFPIDEQLLYEHLQDPNHIKSLFELEKYDKMYADHPDQFSDLRLAKCYMVEESNEIDVWITCFACDTDINNEENDIFLHIESSEHVKKCQMLKSSSKKLYKNFHTLLKNVWYYAQHFICEICNVKCDLEIDFVKHLEDSKHMKKLKKLKEKGVNTQYQICSPCTTYLLGKSDSYKLHCESFFHKRFVKNGDFSTPKMSNMTIDLLKNVDEKILSLISESDKANEEKYKEHLVLESIIKTVEHKYPSAKVYVFGSRISNLGFLDSDVDVFLDLNNSYYKSSQHLKSQQYLMSIKEDFENDLNTWIEDEIRLDSRVPIIKLRHIPTGLKCDISCSNGISVEKSTLIRYYTKAYPICRMMILYLKKWLTSCKLSGYQAITTFAASWLVIFYLQMEKILPSVYQLIKRKNQSKLIDGWECGFSESFFVNHSDISFKDHLKKFYMSYENLNYKTNVICPYLGTLIRKSDFAYTDMLPLEMQIYKNRLEKDDSLIFRFDSPMCIQDPVDLSQNMTKAVKKLQLRSFIEYCKESYERI